MADIVPNDREARQRIAQLEQELHELRARFPRPFPPHLDELPLVTFWLDDHCFGLYQCPILMTTMCAILGG